MRAHLIAGLGAAILFAGCATIRTEKVTDLNSRPEGVRVYPPRIYLAVDKEHNKSQLYILPDYQRAYDIKPLTVLAKNDFSIELDDGKISKLTSNQDTTGILTFISQAGQAAAKGAGLPVSGGAAVEGSFGLASGIWRLGDDGVFRKVN